MFRAFISPSSGAAAEMKYVRRTTGYIWTDYKTNEQIAKKLKITPILHKLLEYCK
jgi:hypothetical protein